MKGDQRSSALGSGGTKAAPHLDGCSVTTLWEIHKGPNTDEGRVAWRLENSTRFTSIYLTAYLKEEMNFVLHHLTKEKEEKYLV